MNHQNSPRENSPREELPPPPLQNPKRRPTTSKHRASKSHKNSKTSPARAKALPCRDSSSSSSSSGAHWVDKQISLRRVSDSIMSGVRSVSGSVRSLSRRLITPPVERRIISAGQPPPSREPPLPAPYSDLDHGLNIRAPNFAIRNQMTPVLVEYMTHRNGPAQRRSHKQSSGGVVYLSTDPLVTLESFVDGARSVAFGEEGLYDVDIGARDEFADLWACWNQGSPEDRVDSRVIGDEEFKRVVELMAARGWKDKFLMCYRSTR
ncbi:uncharacterized protein RCO7_04259 [Rhynchosporium graminicola]|uniref:Uncharacterized protein n=1 Tax=Rhynchosporium graminicola TaxID=2792576 RepID=A0A1E1LRB5_9HELO|nr:uncharacterized protein RCO7_04259 [Rhynchosporium commune]